MRMRFLCFALIWFLFPVLADARKNKKSARRFHAQRVIFQPETWSLPDIATNPPPPNAILITLDDGPRSALTKTPDQPSGLTERALDLMKANHIKGIFFVNGHFMPASLSCSSLDPALTATKHCAYLFELQRILKRIDNEGHQVGNHTVSHPNLCSEQYKQHPESARFEIEDNARRIKSVLERSPSFFRIPFGSRCDYLTGTKSKPGLLQQLRIAHTGWDIDSEDWRRHDAQKTFATIVYHLYRMPADRKKPIILLMHDTHASNLNALQLFLEWTNKVNQRYPGRIRFADPTVLLPEPVLVADVRFIGEIIKQAWTRFKAALVPVPVVPQSMIATNPSPPIAG